jgi:hypothetical protein
VGDAPTFNEDTGAITSLDGNILYASLTGDITTGNQQDAFVSIAGWRATPEKL